MNLLKKILSRFGLGVYKMGDELVMSESSYYNTILELQKSLAELKARKFANFNNEDCWIWMGDGNDHLESLTCPVVISPSDLMELISPRNTEPPELTYAEVTDCMQRTASRQMFGDTRRFHDLFANEVIRHCYVKGKI